MTSLRAAMVRFNTLDPALWSRVARNLASLGFNALDLPVVWREHERAPGTFDLASGRHDLRAMLSAAAAQGLRAVVRLGPLCCDDAAGLGVPERVLRDRACQARTPRQNPVLVLDAPRLVPLPSVASQAYRREAEGWVEAAARALGPDLASGVIARVIVGHGPLALAREHPASPDHHPDALGEPAPSPDSPDERARLAVARETEHQRAFLLGLAAAAERGGVPSDLLALALPDPPLASPLAAALGRERRLSFVAPPPQAGASGLWREVRYACALGPSPHADVRSGFAPHAPPARATHAAQAARIALAAGVRDYTVRTGCAGGHWIGALLDERGDPRAHAPYWKLLNEWAAGLPSGEERAAELPTPARVIAESRARSAVRPLSLGALGGWLGLGPGALAVDESGLPARERALVALERRLDAAGLPWRRSPDEGPTPDTESPGEPDVAPFVADAFARFGDVSPTVQPPGAALVRALTTEDGTWLLVLASSEQPVEVIPPPGVWRLADDPEGVAPPTVTVEPGEAAVLFRRRAS